MPDCIFCKIVKGEIPSYKVYENDSVLAFLDIHPVAPGHTLIIPKKHFVNIEDIPDDELGELYEVIRAVKVIGGSMKSNLGAKSYNIIENNDPEAGQIIPHIHFHIIPRKEEDGLRHWPQKKYGEGEADEILKKIKVG